MDHKRLLPHYYGDTVRKLFLTAAFLMAATLPFFAPLIGQSLLLSVMGILVLAVAAGLTSPAYSLSALLNVLIALAGIVVFERYAVARYLLYRVDDIFFWANQILALVFLAALYYGIKTLRGAGTKVEKIEYGS